MNGIRMEAARIDRLRMSPQYLDYSAGTAIPQPERRIFRRAQNRAAIRTESAGSHGARMAAQDAQASSSPHIPQPQRSIHRRTHDEFPLGAERATADRIAMTDKYACNRPLWLLQRPG